MGNGKLGNGKNDRVEKKCNENLVSRSDGNSCLGNKKWQPENGQQRRMGIYIDKPIFCDSLLNDVMPYRIHTVHRRGLKLFTVHSAARN